MLRTRTVFVAGRSEGSICRRFMCSMRSLRPWRAFGQRMLPAVVLVGSLEIFVNIGLPASAAGQTEAGWVKFDIPAQPLASALNAYGTATRVELFVDTTLTEGRRSVALKGTFTSEAGLQSLLAGTGLVALPVGRAGFTLVQARPDARAAGDAESSSTVLRFAGFSGMLQAALRYALCRRDETRPGNYRTLIRLWIDSSGSVADAILLTSTGDEKRDAMLSDALRRLSVGEPPPSDLPQPLTLLLVPNAEKANQYCSSDLAPGRAHFNFDGERAQ